MDRLLPFIGDMSVQVFPGYTPFLLAILPPGAFLFMGCLIALKNVLDKHLAKPDLVEEIIVPGSKRVRVTR